MVTRGTSPQFDGISPEIRPEFTFPVDTEVFLSIWQESDLAGLSEERRTASNSASRLPLKIYKVIHTECCPFVNWLLLNEVIK